MRALVYTGHRTLELHERPEPVPGPGEVTVEVELVGICGSDILGYLGRSPGRHPPLVLGHEFTGWWKGQPVVVNPIVSCGTCPQCGAGHENLCPKMRLAGLHHDGAMSERITIPQRNVIVLNGDDRHELMVLAEPFACGLHATNLVPSPAEGRSLIIGFGCLGCMTAAAIRHLGGKHIDIIDLSPDRSGLAARFGARSIAPDAVRAETYDHIYDCVGYHSSRTLSERAVVRGGHIVLIGYGEPEGGIDFTDVVRREVHLHGVMAYSASEFRQAVVLLREGVLDSDGLVRIRPLEDGQAAFDEVQTLKSNAIKTALRVRRSHN